MKIIEVIPQLSSGGAERFTADLCNELSKDNHVRLIVLFPLDEYGFYLKELSPNVEVISFNKKSGFSFRHVLRMLKEIKSFNPDIVHSHLRGILYTSLAAVLHRKKTKYFHTIHSDAKKEASDKVSRLCRKILFKNNWVKPIAISEESLISFQKFYGRECDKIDNGRAVPESITITEQTREEINLYKKTNSTRIIVNLARIIGLKRQPLIARVCKRLLEEGYDFSMLIIGREEDPKIAKEIQEIDCKCVKLLGERPNPLEYLKTADGYCLFSEYEGLPISLIEALGTATVPICTPVGGMVNVIKDSYNGILAKDISEEECYIALKRFLDMPTTDLENMKQNALTSFKPYGMSDCAHKYEKVFKQ